VTRELRHFIVDALAAVAGNFLANRVQQNDHPPDVDDDNGQLKRHKRRRHSESDRVEDH